MMIDADGPGLIDVSPWAVTTILGTPGVDECRVHIGSGPWTVEDGTALLVSESAHSLRERVTAEMRDLFTR